MSALSPQFCIECGAPLRVGASFCAACGVAIVRNSALPQPAAVQPATEAIHRTSARPVVHSAVERGGFSYGSVFCPVVWHWAYSLRVQAVVIVVFLIVVQVIAYHTAFPIFLLGVIFPALNYWLFFYGGGVWGLLGNQTLALLESYLLLVIISLPFGNYAYKQAWRNSRFASIEAFQQAQARWGRRAWILPAILVSVVIICSIMMHSVRGR